MFNRAKFYINTLLKESQTLKTHALDTIKYNNNK